MATDMKSAAPLRSEIDHEIQGEEHENKVIKTEGERLTRIEIRTVGDIAESLAEIQRIIESHRNNLPQDERLRIAHLLEEISGKEAILNKGLHEVRKLFQEIEVHDAKQLQEIKERMAKADGKERQILKAEIKEGEEKLEIEKTIVGLEGRLARSVASFNECLGLTVQHIKDSPYPYDAKPCLAKARVILRDISEILKEVKGLEERIIKLTKLEKRLLKKERENV